MSWTIAGHAATRRVFFFFFAQGTNAAASRMSASYFG